MNWYEVRRFYQSIDNNPHCVHIMLEMGVDAWQSCMWHNPTSPQAIATAARTHLVSSAQS